MEEKKRVDAVCEFDLNDFVKSFIGVVKMVITRPSEFYGRMPTRGGFVAPITFLAVCLGVSGVLAAMITGGRAVLFFKIILTGLIFSFIGAGILYVIAQKLFLGKAEYQGTYRLVAYAGAVNLLAWIPIVNFLAALYGFYLQIIGLEKIHQITKGQAVITILIAFVVYLIFFFAIS